jgi:hypothetical protein
MATAMANGSKTTARKRSTKCKSDAQLELGGGGRLGDARVRYSPAGGENTEQPLL